MKMLKKPESFIDLPKVFIKKSALESVFSGAQVMAPAVESMEPVEKGERVAMYCGKEFIGIGIAKIPGKEIKGKTKGLAVKLERVHKALNS